MRALRVREVIAVTVLVATLVGCTSAVPEPSALLPSTSVSTISPTPLDANDAPDRQGREDGMVAAEVALTAFLKRDLPYDAWWAQLKPVLTPEAVFAYEYTDPASVPVTAITGAPIVSAAPSGTQMNVLVPTGIGQYLVVLYRENSQAGWTVDRLSPPAETGP